MAHLIYLICQRVWSVRESDLWGRSARESEVPIGREISETGQERCDSCPRIGLPCPVESDWHLGLSHTSDSLTPWTPTASHLGLSDSERLFWEAVGAPGLSPQNHVISPRESDLWGHGSPRCRPVSLISRPIGPLLPGRVRSAPRTLSHLRLSDPVSSNLIGRSDFGLSDRSVLLAQTDHMTNVERPCMRESEFDHFSWTFSEIWEAVGGHALWLDRSFWQICLIQSESTASQKINKFLTFDSNSTSDRFYQMC